MAKITLEQLFSNSSITQEFYRSQSMNIYHIAYMHFDKFLLFGLSIVQYNNDLLKKHKTRRNLIECSLFSLSIAQRKDDLHKKRKACLT